MKRIDARSGVALLAGLLILVLVNLSIAGKERLLAEGRLVYMELAPIDPRSIMQGDYMALNYRIAQKLQAVLPHREQADSWSPDLAAGDGRIVVALDENSIATFKRIDDGSVLAGNEVLLRYRVRAGQLKLASNAFFFREGTAGRYESARYGCFRVAQDGELLLTALHDEQLRKLGDES